MTVSLVEESVTGVVVGGVGDGVVAGGVGDGVVGEDVGGPNFRWLFLSLPGQTTWTPPLSSMS